MLVLIGALLASFILPLAIFFFLKGAHDDETYKKDCNKLLLKGLLLGFPVFGFSLVCSLVFHVLHLDETFPLAEVLFKTFVLFALSEELMKYLVARKTIDKNRSTVSYLDVMSYTAISAIGFELMEAVFYMLETNVGQILVRGLTSMHATFGLIMGWVLARGYKKGSKNPQILAVLVPVVIPGLYDLSLSEAFSGQDWAAFVAVTLAAACLIINIYNFFYMKKRRKDPYFTEPLFPEK